MYKHNRRRLKSTDGFKRVCDKDKLIWFRSYIGPPFICLGGVYILPPSCGYCIEWLILNILKVEEEHLKYVWYRWQYNLYIHHTFINRPTDKYRANKNSISIIQNSGVSILLTHLVNNFWPISFLKPPICAYSRTLFWYWICKISLDGICVEEICEVVDGLKDSWHKNSAILFSQAKLRLDEKVIRRQGWIDEWMNGKG